MPSAIRCPLARGLSALLASLALSSCGGRGLPAAVFRLNPAELSLLWLTDDRPAFPCDSAGSCATDPELRLLDVQEVRFSREPAPGILRVVCVGDSTTAGWPYHPRGGYPEWMAAVLADLLPGRRTEVLNLGVHAWDGLRLEKVFDEALSFQPAAVVLRIGYNDPNLAFLRRPPGRLGRLRLAAYRGLIRRSSLFRLVLRWFAHGSPQDPKALLARSAGAGDRDLDALILEHRGRLARLADRARAARVPLVLLDAPFWEGFGRATWDRRYLPRLASATAETARELSVPFAPLSDVRGPGGFVDSVHPDLEGYRLTALGALRGLEGSGFGGKGWRWDRLKSAAFYRQRLGLEDPEYRTHLEVRLALFFSRHRYPEAAGRHMENAVRGAPNPDMVPIVVGATGDSAFIALYREAFSRLHGQGKAALPRQRQSLEVVGLR